MSRIKGRAKIAPVGISRKVERRTRESVMWAYTGRVMDVSVTLENTCSAYIDARNATSVCLPFSLANYRPLCCLSLSATGSAFIETDLFV